MESREEASVSVRPYSKGKWVVTFEEEGDEQVLCSHHMTLVEPSPSAAAAAADNTPR
jgi:hypothetical protein